MKLIVDPVDAATLGALEIRFDKAAHRNASAILFDNLQRAPDALAVTGPMGARTFASLCHEASQWAHAFTDFGLARAERIAFYTDDSPTYVAAFFGAARAGFVPVLLNTQSPTDLLQYYLTDSGARLALCEAALIETFSSDVVSGTALERLIIVNGKEAIDDALKLDAATFIEGRPTTVSCADTGPDDMAFWMYSSGSTGRPKGIVHLQHDRIT